MALTNEQDFEREVLQRKLQRLLWLCRALKRSELFGMLCHHISQDGKTALELEAEFMRVLALVNASPDLTPLEIERHAGWVNVHWQAFEDIWAAVRFFEDDPSGKASHVA